MGIDILLDGVLYWELGITGRYKVLFWIFLIAGLFNGGAFFQNSYANITPPASVFSDGEANLALGFGPDKVSIDTVGRQQIFVDAPNGGGVSPLEVQDLFYQGTDPFSGTPFTMRGGDFQGLDPILGSISPEGVASFGLMVELDNGEGLVLRNITPLDMVQTGGRAGFPLLGSYFSAGEDCVGLQDPNHPNFPESPEVATLCIPDMITGPVTSVQAELKEEVQNIEDATTEIEVFDNDGNSIGMFTVGQIAAVTSTLVGNINELLVDPDIGLGEIKLEVFNIEGATTGIEVFDSDGNSLGMFTVGAIASGTATLTEKIGKLLNDPDVGLAEIKAEVANVEDATVEVEVFDPATGESLGTFTVGELVADNNEFLHDPDVGLAEIKAEVATIETTVIDFSTTFNDFSTTFNDFTTTFNDFSVTFNDFTTNFFDFSTTFNDFSVTFNDFSTTFNIFITNFNTFIVNFNTFITNFNTFNTFVTNILLLLAPFDPSTVPVDTCAFAEVPDEPLDMSIASTHKVFRTKIVEKENFFCNFEGDPIAREIAIIIQIEESKRGVPKSSTIDVVQCDKHLNTLQIVCTTYQPASSINPVQSCSPGASFVAMDSGEIVFGETARVKVTTIIVEKEVISCVTDIANNPTHIYDTFILEEMINTEPLRYQTFVCEKDEVNPVTAPLMISTSLHNLNSFFIFPTNQLPVIT